MFCVITNIYNKKTKGPALVELFTATGKLKKFFLQLEMFDVCTTGDTAHIDTIFKLCHTHVNMGALIFFTAAMIRVYSHCEVTWQWWDVLVRPTIAT
jgi:hypothetical protein